MEKQWFFWKLFNWLNVKKIATAASVSIASLFTTPATAQELKGKPAIVETEQTEGTKLLLSPKVVSSLNVRSLIDPRRVVLGLTPKNIGKYNPTLPINPQTKFISLNDSSVELIEVELTIDGRKSRFLIAISLLTDLAWNPINKKAPTQTPQWRPNVSRSGSQNSTEVYTRTSSSTIEPPKPELQKFSAPQELMPELPAIVIAKKEDGPEEIRAKVLTAVDGYITEKTEWAKQQGIKDQSWLQNAFANIRQSYDDRMVDILLKLHEQFGTNISPQKIALALKESMRQDILYFAKVYVGAQLQIERLGLQQDPEIRVLMEVIGKGIRYEVVAFLNRDPHAKHQLERSTPPGEVSKEITNYISFRHNREVLRDLLADNITETVGPFTATIQDSLSPETVNMATASLRSKLEKISAMLQNAYEQGTYEETVKSTLEAAGIRVNKWVRTHENEIIRLFASLAKAELRSLQPEINLRKQELEIAQRTTQEIKLTQEFQKNAKYTLPKILERVLPIINSLPEEYSAIAQERLSSEVERIVQTDNLFEVLRQIGQERSLFLDTRWNDAYSAVKSALTASAYHIRAELWEQLIESNSWSIWNNGESHLSTRTQGELDLVMVKCIQTAREYLRDTEPQQAVVLSNIDSELRGYLNMVKFQEDPEAFLQAAINSIAYKHQIDIEELSAPTISKLFEQLAKLIRVKNSREFIQALNPDAYKEYFDAQVERVLGGKEKTKNASRETLKNAISIAEKKIKIAALDASADTRISSKQQTPDIPDILRIYRAAFHKLPQDMQRDLFSLYSDPGDTVDPEIAIISDIAILTSAESGFRAFVYNPLSTAKWPLQHLNGYISDNGSNPWSFEYAVMATWRSTWKAFFAEKGRLRWFRNISSENKRKLVQMRHYYWDGDLLGLIAKHNWNLEAVFAEFYGEHVRRVSTFSVTKEAINQVNLVFANDSGRKQITKAS